MMIAPADIDHFDVPLIDRIMAAEITTGLHDGKSLGIRRPNAGIARAPI
jgi:hypothetical protein